MLEADAPATALLDPKVAAPGDVLLADADELFAGAAHAANIEAQQQRAMSTVSTLFMIAPFLKRIGSAWANLGLTRSRSSPAERTALQLMILQLSGFP